MLTLSKHFSFDSTNCCTFIQLLYFNELLYILAPLNITQSLSDTNVLLGQNATLSITCDAFPTPKVTW